MKHNKKILCLLLALSLCLCVLLASCKKDPVTPSEPQTGAGKVGQTHVTEDKDGGASIPQSNLQPSETETPRYD